MYYLELKIVQNILGEYIDPNQHAYFTHVDHSAVTRAQGIWYDEVQICPNSPNHNNFVIKVLASDLSDHDNDNARSMVLKLENREENPNQNQQRQQSNMLFLGDLEEVYENPPVRGRGIYGKIMTQQFRAEIANIAVLMIPHHGSASHSNPNNNFYRMVNARYGIISSHVEHKYQHPNHKTIRAFLNNGNINYEALGHDGRLQNECVWLQEMRERRQYCQGRISSWYSKYNVAGISVQSLGQRLFQTTSFFGDDRNIPARGDLPLPTVRQNIIVTYLTPLRRNLRVVSVPYIIPQQREPGLRNVNLFNLA